MYTAKMEDFYQIVRDGRLAREYAIEHRDELVARQHTHTLYGPHDPSLGASIPCNTVVSKQARSLTHKTRRKRYIIYQLDENYKVLRTILIEGELPNKQLIYHHFEFNGTVYAYNYAYFYNRVINFFRYADGKPVCYGELDLRLDFIFIQYYEYLSDDRMFVSTYRYNPKVEQTIYGCKPDPNAPIGAPNSIVQQKFYEVPAEDTDFSRWFK